jgi:pyridoxamine 5'-phosphate oxidase-like protein
MGKEYTDIDDRIQRWMSQQQLFFVSTAPLQADGHVNCSPKGLDSLLVLGPRQLAYVDVGGSGIETVAHLKENGRITIMLCAFDGPPKIFRFYGHGKVIEPHQADFATLLEKFPRQPSVRNIITIDVHRIFDSCGFGVPVYEFRKQRDSFDNYLADKSESFLHNYRREQNATSLDGLKGLEIDSIPHAE